VLDKAMFDRLNTHQSYTGLGAAHRTVMAPVATPAPS
jgi:hypothetical protein